MPRDAGERSPIHPRLDTATHARRRLARYQESEQGTREDETEAPAATAATAAQGFWIHAFPFHMTAEALAGQQDSPWLGFWQQLKAGYDAFETSRIPPHIRVEGGRYVVASV